MTGLPFRRAPLAALLLLLGAAASGPHSAQSFARTPAATPATPATAASIDAILAAQDQDPHGDLRGIVILKNGRQLAERYYHGADADTLHDVRSVGKSITALLLGIAKDSGHIAAVSDPVSLYWPATSATPLGAAVLEHLLTMRSGLAADDDDAASPGHEDRMDAADDPLAFVAALPRADPPGQRYRYNSVTAYAAGVVVAKASGRSLAQFADSQLFAPIGITRWRWEADRAGYTKGQGNLWITARGLAAIGEMVRGQGRYRGKQIVSRDWIRAMLAPTVDIAAVDPYADSYGYFWYGKRLLIGDRMTQIYFASGNGGNKIYVIPDQKLVIAITSAAYGRGHGQRRSEAILKSVLAADIGAASPRR